MTTLTATSRETHQGGYWLLTDTTPDIFQRPGEGPLKLTAVGDRPRHLLRALPYLVRGRPDSFAQPEKGYLSCSARHIRLDMEGGFAVDGELFKAGSRRGAVLIADGGQADFLRL